MCIHQMHDTAGRDVRPEDVSKRKPYDTDQNRKYRHSSHIHCIVIARITAEYGG